MEISYRLQKSYNCCSIINVNARSLLPEDKFAEFQLLTVSLISVVTGLLPIRCVSEAWLFKELEIKKAIGRILCFFDSRRNGIRGLPYIINANIKCLVALTHEPLGGGA